MNTRRNATRIVEEEIDKAGASPYGDHVPTLEEYVNDDQALVNPPTFTDENIRSSLFQMA